MIALAGCVAQAEGAEAKRALEDDRPRRRPAGLSPPARAWSREAARGERPVDTDMPAIAKFGALPARRRQAGRAPSSRSRKAATNSAPIASFPTRAAPRSAGRSATSSPRRRRWSTAARARSPCSARTSTPGRGRRPRGLDGLIRALAAIDGLERIRYTTSHPADMTDALIARAWRGRQVDALPPPAGAVGQRPHPQGDEPQPQRRKLSRASIEQVRAARPDIAISGDFIVGFPGESEEDFAATLAIVDAVRLRLGLFVQIFAAPGHSGGDHGRSGCRRE